MTPSTIFSIFATAVAIDLGWGIFLTVLNYRRAGDGDAAIPAEIRAAIPEADRDKARAYSRANMRLSFLAEPLFAALTLAVAGSGLLGILDRLTRGLFGGGYLGGAALLGLVALIFGVVSVPFGLYSTFVVEKRFGFNTTTIATWIADSAKGLALTVAIGLPLVLLVFFFLDRAGALWWLWAAGAWSAISLAISILFPVLIAPLFNKFTPLPEGSLASSIRALAERLGFSMSGVFVMDGSKRSRHSNAFFAGIGRTKRIVLFDTLVASMGEAEILAVLAHEIGHYKKKHVLSSSAVSISLTFVGFWILSLLKDWTPLYPAFGFEAPSKAALLLVLGICAGPFTFLLTPAFSAWSRSHEYQADRFAVEAAGSGPMRSALVKLNRENAANPNPHPLYSFWHYGHPTLAERLAAIPS